MYNYYSIGEKTKNIISLIYTKIRWKKARLIRLPNYIRNKRNIVYGTNLTTGYNLRLEASDNHKSLFLGSNVIIGDYCHIVGRSKVIIGDNVLIASRVYISDTSHGKYDENKNSSNPSVAPNERKLEYKEVYIGKNVWIGENVCILSGVVIGDGCVIGANAVVTKNVPKNCVVAGIPAKIIKIYNNVTHTWEKYEEG